MNFSNSHKFSSLDSPLQLSDDGFFLLSQSAFSANMPSGMSLKIQCPESLYISLWLRISHRNNHIATILDFSHNATSGCVLQLLSEQDKVGYELCWFCNGSSLTYRAQSSEWIYLTCGYDAAESKSWMSVNNEPIIDCNTQIPPFQNKEVELGIGFWLGGNHREFCGELKELCIAERGIKSFDTRRGPEEAKSEDFYKSVLKETVSNMNESKMGKLPNAMKSFVNGIKRKVIPLHNLGRINNAPSNTFQSSRWSVSLQINDKLIAFVGNFKDYDMSLSLELQEHLANFISYASKEDVIGAAHYLNKICDLGYRIRISTESTGILDIVVSDEVQDTPDFAREIISIDMRHFRDTAA